MVINDYLGSSQLLSLTNSMSALAWPLGNDGMIRDEVNECAYPFSCRAHSSTLP